MELKDFVTQVIHDVVTININSYKTIKIKFDLGVCIEEDKIHVCSSHNGLSRIQFELEV